MRRCPHVVGAAGHQNSEERKAMAVLGLLAQVEFSSAEELAESAGALFFLLMMIAIVVIGLIFVGGWWFFNRRGSKSPYGRGGMVRGTAISYEAVERVHDYLSSLTPSDNPIFSLEKAAICKRTGRIFPDAVNRFDVVVVGWDFLKKRHPGNWVSWGSLTSAERKRVRESHHTLSGFQVEESSGRAVPSQVEVQYMLLKPGPLYVDVKSKVIMGWKVVPETELEVLVVQSPTKG